MTYNRAKEFFLGEDKCELVLEDEAFWKKKNGNDKSPAEINFNILKTNLVLYSFSYVVQMRSQYLISVSNCYLKGMENL